MKNRMKALLSTPLRRMAVNGLIIILSIVVGLFLVELGIRLFGLSSREIILSRGMIPDEHCGFKLQANVTIPPIPGVMPEVNINSLGMRDKEYSAKKPDQTVRVLALGDSFAYGRVHYHFNFLTILEEQLNHHYQDWTIELLNSGVPAYEPVHELAYLKTYGFKYQPDIVLQCIYVGNDLQNNHLAPTELHPGSPLQQMEAQKEQIPFHNLLRWSELYWTILNLTSKAQILHEIEKRIPRLDEESLDDPRKIIEDFWMMSDEEYDAVLRNHAPNFLTADHRGIKEQQQIQTTLAVLNDCAKACKQRDILFMITLIPAEEQVDKTVQQQLLKEMEKEKEPLDFNFKQPQKNLMAEFERLNISAIDLLPAFLENADKQRLYLLRDSHWNEAGNQLAANHLVKPLKQLIDQWISNHESNQ